jgi:hypothetical protein
VDDISSADRGAGRGCEVRLWKRDEDEHQHRLDLAYALGRAVAEVHKLGRGKPKLPPEGKPTHRLIADGDWNAGSPGDKNPVTSDDTALRRIRDAKFEALVQDLMRRDNLSRSQAEARARQLGLGIGRSTSDADRPAASALGGFLAKLGGGNLPAGTADPHRQREKEQSMSKDYCCPSCGKKGPKSMFKPDDDEDDSLEKAALINKAVARTFESIVEDLRKANPAMSKRDAERAAMNSPEYSELVCGERAARLGDAYRFA